jgi:hypothetical protein
MYNFNIERETEMQQMTLFAHKIVHNVLFDSETAARENFHEELSCLQKAGEREIENIMLQWQSAVFAITLDSFHILSSGEMNFNTQKFPPEVYLSENNLIVKFHTF